MASVWTYSLLFSLPLYTIAVTVVPLTLNTPQPYESNVKPAYSEYDLLWKLDPQLIPKETYPFVNGKFNPQLVRNEDLQIDINDFSSHSSYGPTAINETSGIYESKDSLVHSAIEAGIKKQHLVMRPEDVWFTILT
jgi:hypothetical protein